jgi:hypothetical protein
LLQDAVPPPNIALPCGHTVCIDDFRQLGGTVTEREYDSEDEEETQDELEEYEETNREFVRYLEEQGVIEGLPREENEDDDYSRDDDDDHSHDSMPPLEEDSEDDDEEDSDGSMPPLVPRPGVDYSSDDDRGIPDTNADDELDDMPPLIDRAAESDTDDESNASMPGLIARNDNRSDGSSDDDSVPAILSRRGSDWEDGSDEDDAVHTTPGAPTPSVWSDEAIYLVREHQGFAPTILRTNHRGNSVNVRLGFVTPNSRLLPLKSCALVWTPRGEYADVMGFTVNGERRLFAYQRVPSNANVVSDGVLGIWALCPGRNNVDKVLRYFGGLHPEGKLVRRVSLNSVLVQGSREATWVHVRERNQSIEAGLWVFKATGQKKICTADDLKLDAKIVPDGVQEAVWILEKREGVVTVTRIARGDRPPFHRQPVDCEFTKDSSLIPNIQGGVYVHTRKDDHWSLFFFKDSNLRKVQDRCPKDAHIVADAAGNVWVMHKAIRSSSQQILFKVNGRLGTVDESPERQPGNTDMVGAF